MTTCGKAFCIILLLSGCSKSSTSERQRATTDRIKPEVSSNAAPSAPDGPLGITMGEPLSNLDKPKEEAPSIYTISHVPSPYPNVASYEVVNTAQHGTCKIVMISNDLSQDAYGTETKSTIDSVADDVSARYGKPSESFDFLNAGSIWNDAKDWYDGVRQNERHYAYAWNQPKNADQKVWRGVDNIFLEVKANGPKPFWEMDYEFTNFTACQKDMKMNKAKSL